MKTSGEATRTRSGDASAFRPDIEGLRGIAVLLIVAFHACLLSGTNLVGGGFIGVDLFFVVSGYLIMGLLIRERESTGRISLSHFYARRVRRILPAAAVVLAITIPLSYAVTTLVLRPAVMEDAASAALSAANVRFALTTDYFHDTALSPFLHFWSLGVEEQFYLIWPSLLALVLWRGSRKAALLALAAIVSVSFAANVIVTHDNPSWAFFMLPTRAWQFAAGGLLAVGTGRMRTAPGRMRTVSHGALEVAGWVAMAGLVLDAFVLDSASTPYPGVAAVVPTLAGVVLLLAGPMAHGPGMLLRLAPIRFLGRISYSLYLWHWPILVLGGAYVLMPVPIDRTIALVALSVAAAAVSWRFVEEPFRRGTLRLPEPRRLVAWGTAAMLALGVISLALGSTASSTLNSLGAGAQPVAETSQALSALSRVSAPPPPSRSPYSINATTRPSLSMAASDMESARSGCVAGLTDVKPDPTCVFGRTGASVSVALVGDSHASAFFPAVMGVANSNSWQLRTFLKVGCPFVDVLPYSVTLKRDYTECATWDANVLAELKANPPSLILLSTSRADRTADPSTQSSASIGLATARMIRKMPPQSRVVIIQDPPLPGFRVPECLSSHLDDFRKCAYTRAAGFYDLGVREKVAAADAGVPVVSLASEICPGTGDCPVVIRNIIVWRDEQHLTATFAATLASVLQTRLQAVLGPDLAKPAPSTISGS